MEQSEKGMKRRVQGRQKQGRAGWKRKRREEGRMVKMGNKEQS